MVAEIEAELEGIDLKDKRLNERSKRLLNSFWEDPLASVNAAMHGWDESAAAYRFFDNDRIEPKEILRPH
jgi:hypothetical protein